MVTRRKLVELLRIFNEYFEDRKFLARWMIAELIVIYKGKNIPVSCPSSYIVIVHILARYDGKTPGIADTWKVKRTH